MSQDDQQPAGEPSAASLSQAFAEFNSYAEALTTQYQNLEAEVQQLRAQLAEQTKAVRNAEAQRQALAEQYETLLDILPLGMVLIDNRGTVKRANPSSVELLGEPLQNEPWFKVIQRSFAPRKDDGHEISLRSGKRVSVLTNSLPDQTGQIVLLYDLTETRDLQARLSHHERLTAMGRMVAALAHQVRTPLAAAMLYASHLQNPAADEQQRQRFTAKLRSRLNNIERQIRDMLIFARGETQLQDQLSLPELLAQLEDNLDLPLSQHDADCDVINDAGDVPLLVNQEVLIGALLNLVNNALQAAGSGAELVIRSQRSQDEVSISVIDNGPGIAPEQIAKVLQPFYSTKSQGTGLGLAVVQAVAKAHGGRFELGSEPGKTTATLWLPIQQA
ncbi:sensor histidine kinase [Pokkaliibacter sp. CJK22405]|uniref:sensor histidine kinase n=1 Tax=Pokkaliibacter sp. CJK22405 TaxID=3384615 RepID=UPI003985229D